MPATTTLNEAAPAAPIPAAERIHSLDILRGIALFGMIFVHFHQDLGVEGAGGAGVVGVVGVAIRWFVWMFAEEKAWGTFAFLFGAGFAVLLRRMDARGASVTVVYIRRMAGLAVFGIIAQVGFGFRVLFEYAFWGVALLLIRKWSTRNLLIAAAVCASAWSATAMGRWLYLTLTAAPPPAPSRPDVYQALEAARTQADYLVLLAARWKAFVSDLPHDWRGFIPDTNLLLFILGLLAMRHGLLEDPRRHARTIRKWMLFGGLSWGIFWLNYIFLRPALGDHMPPNVQWPLAMGLGFFNDQGLSLTYIGAVVLLLAYAPRWTPRLGAVFGAAGRMALTNYMLQVMAFDILASGYGLSVRVRPTLYLPGAVALFGAEVLLSRAWLARYRFGPLEWVWRCVTYARWQPLRRVGLQPDDTAAALPWNASSAS